MQNWQEFPVNAQMGVQLNCQHSDDISAKLEYQTDSNGNEMEDATTRLTALAMTCEDGKQ